MSGAVERWEDRRAPAPRARPRVSRRPASARTMTGQRRLCVAARPTRPAPFSAPRLPASLFHPQDATVRARAATVRAVRACARA